MRKFIFLAIAFISFFGSNKVFSQDAENTIHQVGEKFGGGIISYVYTGADNKQHGLIVSEENLSDRVDWSANTEKLVEHKTQLMELQIPMQ